MATEHYDMCEFKLPPREQHEITSVMPGLLPDHMIRKLIGITPFSESEKREGIISYGLTSVGYDARLGRRFKVFNNIYGGILDPKKVDPNCFLTIDDADYCLIPPHGYILGESVEEFTIPRDIACIVMGKSTYARNGIIVNVTPGEPEWKGKWTIEISNSSPCPAKVYAGEGIMQIWFFRSILPCEQSYADKKGKYQGQGGLTMGAVDGQVQCNLCRGTGRFSMTINTGTDHQQTAYRTCQECGGSGWRK